MNNDDANTPYDHGLLAKLQHRLDSDQLQAEMSGGDNGRIRRFLSDETIAYLQGGENNPQNKHKMSVFELLMLTNDQFAQKYIQAIEKAEDIGKAIRSALADLDSEAQSLELALVRQQQNAHTLSNGTAIYFNQHGVAHYDSGDLVARHLTEAIEPDIRKTSWEERANTKRRLETVLKDERSIEDYRDEVYAPSYTALRDKNAIQSEDDLDNIMAGFEDAQMPEILKEYMHKDAKVAPAASPMLSNKFKDALNQDVDAPLNLTSAFDTARMDIPVLPPSPTAPSPVPK